MDFSFFALADAEEARNKSGKASPPIDNPPILRKLRRLVPSQNWPEELLIKLSMTSNNPTLEKGRIKKH
tara:strand:- start:909 stop:1115 length:207 start_codon:yes stop_codon:yes gene_type:complete